jgi:hypothetical protein
MQDLTVGPLSSEEGTTQNGLKDLHPENGSSQGQNPALTCVIISGSLESGKPGRD